MHSDSASTFDPKAAGDRVRSLIDEREEEYGLQSKLARHLGVTSTSVNRWSRGNGNPDPAHWPMIEEFFDLPPGTLKAAALGVSGDNPREILAELIAKLLQELDDQIPGETRQRIVDALEEYRHFAAAADEAVS